MLSFLNQMNPVSIVIPDFSRIRINIFLPSTQEVLKIFQNVTATNEVRDEIRKHSHAGNVYCCSIQKYRKLRFPEH
jgi:hypothetical protein